MEVGAVGDVWRDGATEREVLEGELVDAAIVAGYSDEDGSEIRTWVREGEFGPVMEASIGVLKGFE